MKVKTSELIGKSLDFAVSIALGHEMVQDAVSGQYFARLNRDQLRKQNTYYSPNEQYRDLPFVGYSTLWSHGGPLIDSERIDVFCSENQWCAQMDCRVHSSYGKTALIAAMRCFVASVFGEEVDLPQDIL